VPSLVRRGFSILDFAARRLPDRSWGPTGIGHPDTIIKLLAERPVPGAVQCIANLLDSPGGLKFFDGPAKPRAVMAAACATESAS
jgi:hypothetical protein